MDFEEEKICESTIKSVVNSFIHKKWFGEKDRNDLTQELWRKALECVKLNGVKAGDGGKLYHALKNHLIDIYRDWDKLSVADGEHRSDADVSEIPDHNAFGSIQEDYVIGRELLNLIVSWANGKDEQTRIFVMESLSPSNETLAKWEKMTNRKARIYSHTLAGILNIKRHKHRMILQDLRNFLRKNGFQQNEGLYGEKN